MGLRLRKQRHKASCGLACVSMIANVPYNTVIEDYLDFEDVGWEVFNRDDGGTYQCLGYNTSVEKLFWILRHYGIRSNKRWSLYKFEKDYLPSKDDLPELSILAINKRKTGGWHWVVCEKEGKSFKILDPFKGEYTISSDMKIHAIVRVHIN